MGAAMVTAVGFAMTMSGGPAVAAEGSANTVLHPAPVASGSEIQTAASTYNDLDIVMLFLAGRGRIADAHPGLAEKLVPVKAPEQPQAAYESVLEALYEADPGFHDLVTIPLQSGDPFAVEAAIVQFRADIESFAPAQDTGAAVGRCVVGIWFFIGSAVAVVVAAVVGAVAVPVYAVYYMPDKDAKDFDLQAFAATIARTL
ncbi:hypothetical protein N136_02264 [Leifsonia aquatica ATCC 14665]|nr:hypothetical protein N136_02264 [Leifsonia aquatica ATCC 14665]